MPIGLTEAFSPVAGGEDPRGSGRPRGPRGRRGRAHRPHAGVPVRGRRAPRAARHGGRTCGRVQLPRRQRGRVPRRLGEPGAPPRAVRADGRRRRRGSQGGFRPARQGRRGQAGRRRRPAVFAQVAPDAPPAHCGGRPSGPAHCRAGVLHLHARAGKPASGDAADAGAAGRAAGSERAAGRRHRRRGDPGGEADRGPRPRGASGHDAGAGHRGGAARGHLGQRARGERGGQPHQVQRHAGAHVRARRHAHGARPRCIWPGRGRRRRPGGLLRLHGRARLRDAQLLRRGEEREHRGEDAAGGRHRRARGVGAAAGGQDGVLHLRDTRSRVRSSRKAARSRARWTSAARPTSGRRCCPTTIPPRTRPATWPTPSASSTCT